MVLLWTSLSLAFPIIHMLSANGRNRTNTKTEEHIQLPVQWFFIYLFFFPYSVIRHRVIQTELQTENEWK